MPSMGGGGRKAKTLMVQGTASYAGKTLLVTAFCKLFADMGYRVAPFKAQNMSLNSYVTEDGCEIARAQALQAFAAGVEPTADMNPILLKPKGNASSQIILLGKPYRDIEARDYFTQFAMKEGLANVKDSLERLRSRFDLVVIEGAGSPAEPNLYDFEIANMKVAELAYAPVLLVADIDRGGAFASIIGTLQLLKKKHRALVKGFVINKFRGDPVILEPALRKLEAMTGKPVLGVLPYLENLEVPSEDSVSLEQTLESPQGTVDIAVLKLPRISNYTDFDPLRAAGARIRFVTSLRELGKPSAVIIPGTKNTVQDLLWLRNEGFDGELERLRGENVPIVGICGGFQILGRDVIDESGLEGGVKGRFDGLGFLNIKTVFSRYSKLTTRVTAKVIGHGPVLAKARGRTLAGYEIHMGKTQRGGDAPLLRIVRAGKTRVSRLDGATSKDGLVLGSYVHGLFDDSVIRNSLLHYLNQKSGRGNTHRSFTSIQKVWQNSLEKLARIVAEHIEIRKVCSMMRLVYRHSGLL